MTAAESTTTASRLPPFLHSRVGGLPRSFWVLWAGNLVNRLGTMVEPYLGLYLTTVRGLSLAEAGAVVALFGVGSLFAQLIGGILADRIGRRTTLTLATLCTGFAMLMLAYVESTAGIVVFTLLLGLTIDMYRPASLALVADLISPAERPRAYGLLFWAVNLGWACAVLVGGALARHGFVWLFWVDAVTCVAFGLLVWRAVPKAYNRPAEDAGDIGGAAGGKRRRGGFAGALRDRVLLGYLLVMLLYTFVLMQCLTTMPLAMKEQGLSPQDYGVAFAVNGLVIITVQPLVVAALARRDHSLVIAAGVLVVGAGFGLNSLAHATWAFAATVVVWTLGEIAVASVSQAVVADLAPAHLRGRYGGLWGIAWSAGFLLAPLGGTRLLAIGAPALWLTCTALCAVAAAGQLLLGPAIRRRRTVFSS